MALSGSSIGGIAGGTMQSIAQIMAGVNAQKLAKGNAELLRLQGEQAVVQGRREAKKLRGAQRARFAKGGVDPDEGTALDVQLESEEQVMLAARRARLAFETEAIQQTQAGSIALTQGLFSAGSTLLGTVNRAIETARPKELT